VNKFYIREDDDMSQERINSDVDDTTRFGEGVGLVIGLALLFVFLLWCALWPKQAHAQTCTVGGTNSCFVASKTSGESPLATTLTWNVVGASACTASGGGTPWTGSVAASGTKNLSGITVPMTLKLDCTAPATAGKMRVTWTPPTQNTDGSPATLAGYIVSYGTAAAALNQTVNLAVPGATAYDLTGLTAGTWFASLQAAAGDCFPTAQVSCHVSLSSAVVSKAVTTTPGGALPQLSLAIDPFQVPKPPTNVVATDVTAVELRTNADGTLLATQIHLAPIRTTCVDAECTVLARRQ
jgi:hypothetical protein